MNKLTKFKLIGFLLLTISLLLTKEKLIEIFLNTLNKKEMKQFSLHESILLWK